MTPSIKSFMKAHQVLLLLIAKKQQFLFLHVSGLQLLFGLDLVLYCYLSSHYDIPPTKFKHDQALNRRCRGLIDTNET